MPNIPSYVVAVLAISLAMANHACLHKQKILRPIKFYERKLIISPLSSDCNSYAIA